MQIPPEQVKRLADEYIKDALTKVEEARTIEEAKTCGEVGESVLKLAVILSALTASVVLVKGSSCLGTVAHEADEPRPSFVEG